MIPKNLYEIHSFIQSKKQKNGEDYMNFDYDYYHLEDTFVTPLFCKSQIIINLANNLSNSKNIRTLKIQFRKFAEKKLNDFNLIVKEEHLSVQFKYSFMKKDISYYSGLRRTIYINDNLFKRALNNKENCIELLYVFMHEFAHAVADRWFSNSENHNEYFHYSNMKVFQNFTGINVNNVYRYIDPKIKMNYDQLCEEKGMHFRISNKNIKIQKFKSFKQAIFILNSRYNTKLNFPKVLQNIKFSKKKKKIPEFEFYSKSSETIKIPLDDSTKLGSKYTIRIIRIEDGVIAIISKTEQIKKNILEKYITYLKRIKNDRTI